jgi:hypothetical protein
VKTLEDYLREQFGADVDDFVLHVSRGPRNELAITITPDFDMRARSQVRAVVHGDRVQVIAASYEGSSLCPQEHSGKAS